MIKLANSTVRSFIKRYKRGALRTVRTTLFDEDGPKVGTCWLDVATPHTVLEVETVGEKLITFTGGNRLGVRQFFVRVHDERMILVGCTPDYVPSKVVF